MFILIIQCMKYLKMNLTSRGEWKITTLVLCPSTLVKTVQPRIRHKTRPNLKLGHFMVCKVFNPTLLQLPPGIISWCIISLSDGAQRRGVALFPCFIHLACHLGFTCFGHSVMFLSLACEFCVFSYYFGVSFCIFMSLSLCVVCKRFFACVCVGVSSLERWKAKDHMLCSSRPQQRAQLQSSTIRIAWWLRTSWRFTWTSCLISDLPIWLHA